MGQLNQLMAGNSGSIDLQALLLSLVVAFLLGQLLAWTYSLTHTGLSYSSSFVQSISLISVSSTMVMFVVGNSLVTAFGLLGALAIIRFRNNLKDTRDTVFVFFALIVGMAIGNQRLPAGVVATLFFCGCSAYLYFTSFGARSLFDGHLRCRVESDADNVVSSIINDFCFSYREVSASHGVQSTEFVYEVLLKDKSNSSAFIQALRDESLVQDVGLVVRDGLQES